MAEDFDGRIHPLRRLHASPALEGKLSAHAYFPKELWRTHGFPFSEEFHTREFLLDKDPYRNLGFDGPNLKASSNHPYGIVCYPKKKDGPN